MVADRRIVETTLPPLVGIMGPTASGKTDLAIALAGELDCELISVDSALVYRGLDIGSAKPDYPHHLVDIRDPADVYSVADFVVDAARIAHEVVQRGRIPILVGGSMLYFRAFLQGLAPMPAANPALREELERRAATEGWEALHRELEQVDPEAAGRIHPRHSRRLVRALEVYRTSGITLTEWHRDAAHDAPAAAFNTVLLAVCPEQRAELHYRIEHRFHKMMKQGFLEEVRRLHERGDLHRGLPAIRAAGYRQLWDHLEGECTLREAEARGIVATRQLAKRQLTWLRGWPGLNWVDTPADEKNSIKTQKPLKSALNYLASVIM